MALPATAVWECRANAANSGLQGGFFDPAGSGVDYSQQDSAQLEVTDGATDGAGTTLTSATGSFTAQMDGNGAYLTGGGATAGWYNLTYVDANTMTLDRSAGASKTGVTVRVGGASLLEKISAYVVDGNKLHIKNDATHNLGASASAPAGTFVLLSECIGYNSTRGDEPTGNNRPLIACGAYAWSLNNMNVRNFRVTGTSAYVFNPRVGVIRNIDVYNSSATASRTAVNFSSYKGIAVQCRAQSDAGYGFLCSSNVTFVGCVAENCSERGFSIAGSQVVKCLSRNNGTGIYFAANSTNGVYGSVIYNNTNGVDQVSTLGAQFVNCIFDSNTLGVKFSGASGQQQTMFAHCVWNNNTADLDTGLFKHDGNLSVDPQFVNAAGSDFATQNTDLHNAAWPMELPGTITENYEDIGFQIEASTGSGGTRGFASFG